MPVTSGQNWAKLVTAGCIVGVLSSVSVRANAYEYEDPATYDDGLDDAYTTTAYGDGYDEADGYYAPDDEEYAPVPEDAEYAEEPDEEVEAPEEEDEEDAMAPTALAPDSDEELIEVDPAEIEALGYSAIQNVDYIPGPDKLADVADVDNFTAEDAEECVLACEENPLCNLAAFFTEEEPFGQPSNCFMKGLSPGCTVPEDLDEVENGWLFLSDTKCDVTVSVAPDALAPTAVTGVYTAYPGFDYIPFDALAAPTPPNLVLVEDIPDSAALVDDQAECEEMCDGTPECNAASFYIEELGGFNCFLKTIAEACELPADAIEDPNATLLLRCDSPLGIPLAAAPAADAPLVDPFGVPDAGAPLEAGATDITGTRDTDTTGDDGEVTGDTDVAVSMCSSVAAIAVAGAAAVFM